MSRAAVSKSRADKKAASAQPQQISHEIIPGKYTDNDWSSMLEHDEDDDYITDIMDELLKRTIDVIYNKYIEKQLLPFTISQAKDAILQIIEWQFLARDEGEPLAETDSGWLEDEEPQPAITDCWAQGAVPKKLVHTPRIESVCEEPIIVEDLEETDKQGENDLELEPSIEKEKVEETENKPNGEAKESTVPKPSKQKIMFKPRTGRMRYDALNRLHESLEDTEKRLSREESQQIAGLEDNVDDVELDDEYRKILPSCNSIVKAQQGRPPGEKDVIYDEYGNVVSIKRIDPAKLPTHRVKVNYTIVDPQIEAEKSKLNAMKTGKYKYVSRSQTLNKNKSKIATQQKTRGNERPDVTANLANRPSEGSIAPLPPPLIDSMEVSPGVVVRERSRVKRGPKIKPKQLDTIPYDNLRPVGLYKQMPALKVAELLDRQTPILKAMAPSPPIPPIPPQQS